MMADFSARVQRMPAYCYRKGHWAKRGIKSLTEQRGVRLYIWVCLRVCVYMCLYVWWWWWWQWGGGRPEITMLIEALCPGAAASDSEPPSSWVSVTFSTQRQIQGSQIHPTLQGQNQLPERWNSLIKPPNDNCSESAMIWLTIQTTIGIASSVLAARVAGISMIIVLMLCHGTA